MEPTDEPPPTLQTWAETSAWADAEESQPVAAESAAAEPATPAQQPVSAALPSPEPAIARWPPEEFQPATKDDYVRPTVVPGKIRTSRVRNWIVPAAVLTELVVIAAGCNQWVGKKVFDYADGPQNGFWHQFVYSTQAYYWRATKATGESTSQFIAALVRVGAVLALSALVIGLVVRSGSFWRAAIGSLVAVVFATQVAAIIGGLFWETPSYAPRYALGMIPDSGEVGIQQTQTFSGPGGGRATAALFSSPTGYRFVGGVMLGVIIGLVVGMIAKRNGEAVPARAAFPPAPPQAFFPPGEMQRTFEAGAAPTAPTAQSLAPPGAFTPKPESGSGRHSRE